MLWDLPANAVRKPCAALASSNAADAACFACLTGWPIKFDFKTQQQPVQVKVGLDAPKPQVNVVQDAPKQQQEVKVVQDAPKKQQEKFATCAEATTKVQGYTYVQEALKQCPDLQAMQADPNVAKTFFVPSDKVINTAAKSSHHIWVI